MPPSSDHSLAKNDHSRSSDLGSKLETRTVSPVNLGELLNLVGLSTGVVLYAMLLAMVIRARRARRHCRFRSASSLDVSPRIALEPVRAARLRSAEIRHCRTVSAGLGHRIRRARSVAGRRRALGAAPRRQGSQRRSGIGRSQSLRTRSARSRRFSISSPRCEAKSCRRSDAMRLLTYTFVALVVPLAAATRGQPGSRRALWIAALAVFAVSALHLSQLHAANPSWPVELLGHHASLPLALAILYQDYPFALADLFLKRALALLAVVVDRLCRGRHVRRSIRRRSRHSSSTIRGSSRCS